ncbi:sarcosine oxidase [Streptomyces sp. SAI-170]|uniref:NAD(P)/FAD-dependent oxidoreductase n=1 Tax=Streptomyces sp. SAI-170 TaxID=3377729 RepID=UPI003C7BA135
MHEVRSSWFAEDDETGMAVKDLVGPLSTLTVLLLAFVLDTATGSYGKAEVAAPRRGPGPRPDHGGGRVRACRACRPMGEVRLKGRRPREGRNVAVVVPSPWSAVVQNVEIVVVGAGMFGSAAGKYLSRAGADVTVIGPPEPARRAEAGLPEFGAHHDEARIVRRLGRDPFWGTVDARSAGRLRAMEAQTGIGFFQECGSLAVMATSIRSRTDSMLRTSAGDGIAVERLSDTDMRGRFPGLGLPPIPGGVEGLLETKEAGHLNPRRLVKAQLDLMTASGGRLLRGAVTEVRKDRRTGLWRLRVAGTQGGGLEVGAEKVLIATGALINHSKALPAGCRELGLQVFTEPNLLFEVEGNQIERLRDLPTVVTVDPTDSGNDNMSLYLLPPHRYPDGKSYLRIGPAMQPLVHDLRTAEEIHAWYARERITAEQSAFLTCMMRLLLPGLEPVSVREASCVVDKTPSRYPYIGHLGEDESLSVVAGGNGHGARGSDEIGRLASTVVLGTAWDFPVPRDRFAPLPADAGRADDGRPGYLKPPFGLC